MINSKSKCKKENKSQNSKNANQYNSNPQSSEQDGTSIYSEEVQQISPSKSVNSNGSSSTKQSLCTINNQFDEYQQLCECLEQLSMKDKREASILTQEMISFYNKNDIDCVGCAIQLQQFIQDIMSIANKQNKVMKLEDIVIYPDFRIGLNDSILGNNQKLSNMLISHKKNYDNLHLANSNLCLKKKCDNQISKNHKQHRCLLHSQKSITNSVWKNSIKTMIDTNFKDLSGVTDIQETLFLDNLQNYLKKRKFCTTCKENIVQAYEDLKEIAESPEEFQDEDEEEEDEEQEEQNIEHDAYYSEPELSMGNHNFNKRQHEFMHRGYYHSKSLEKYEIVQKGCDCECHYKQNSICTCNCHEQCIEESNQSEQCEDTTNYDLLSLIKISKKNQKIYVPFQKEIFLEILNKAEVDTSLQVRHASTKEASQEELLICLGITLKESMQLYWKKLKSEEIIRLLFMKTFASCLKDQLLSCHQSMLSRLGHKTIIEEYLNDEEINQVMKKEKLRKKRNKKKEKKKQLKGNDKQSEISEQSSEADKIYYSTSSLKQQIQLTPQPNKVQNDKFCDNYSSSKRSSDIFAEDKLVREFKEDTFIKQKKNSNQIKPIVKYSENAKKYQEWNEREQELIKNMGLDQQSIEEDTEISEVEVNQFITIWKDIENKRDMYRKHLKDQFKNLLMKCNNQSCHTIFNLQNLFQ